MASSPQAPDVTCPRCQGVGFYIDDTNTTRRCDCGVLEERGRRDRLAQAAIPKRFADKGFDNFRVPKGDKLRAEVLRSAHAWAQSFTPSEQGLMLRGSPGSGKTHIAVAILRAVLDRGYSGIYWNFSDLLERIRNTFGGGSDTTQEELLGPMESLDLLVLDDVGAESTSDWVRDRLYLIINRRYEAARPLVITTNCSEAELAARVGPRTASRLYEICAESFPPFPKEDWRQANFR